jgi:peptidoglycan hydrolase-like protein with peptidoglycan-binding domain
MWPADHAKRAQSAVTRSIGRREDEMYPMLRFGSQGTQVKTLQAALNIWSGRSPPVLVEDGIFGPKTRMKVVEYQVATDLVPDGIVGPKTWAMLQPLIDELAKLIPPPASDKEAQERIATAATMALSHFGWGGGAVIPQKWSHKIAAARCVNNPDPNAINSCLVTDPPTSPGSQFCCRLSGTEGPRQGGDSLRMIFQVAGASVTYQGNCPTIHQQEAKLWNPKNTAALNARMPQWCGIFCYYIYRMAGIHLGGWTDHQSNIFGAGKKFRSFSNPAHVQRGYIGCIDGIRSGGRNHHFIVMRNEDGVIHSVDGNADTTVDKQYAGGVQSVIAPRSYTHYELKAKEAYFLFPDLSKL